jgi:hypothetical protein
MKKSGGKPILDTYVQLAFGVATMLSRRPDKTPSARHILSILERLEHIDDWSQHKLIGVFMTVLKATALHTEEPAKVIAAAKRVWEKSDPFDHPTTMTPDEVEKFLTHYLMIMEISTDRNDWNYASGLLHHLVQYPSAESRLSALRIARRCNDSIMAKHYWHKFIRVPFDKRAGLSYLRILSLGKDSKEALAVLEQLLPYDPSAINFMQALLPCVRQPNVDIAKRILDLVYKNPAARRDIPIHSLMLKILLRATMLPQHRPPNHIYGVLKKMNLPDLLKLKDVPADIRLGLIELIKPLIAWRKDQRMSELDRKLIEGDQVFFMRWEEIIRNENKAKSPAKHVPSDIGAAKSADVERSQMPSRQYDHHKSVIYDIPYDRPTFPPHRQSTIKPSTERDSRTIRLRDPHASRRRSANIPPERMSFSRLDAHNAAVGYIPFNRHIKNERGNIIYSSSQRDSRPIRVRDSSNWQRQFSTACIPRYPLPSAKNNRSREFSTARANYKRVEWDRKEVHSIDEAVESPPFRYPPPPPPIDFSGPLDPGDWPYVPWAKCDVKKVLEARKMGLEAVRAARYKRSERRRVKKEQVDTKKSMEKETNRQQWVDEVESVPSSRDTRKKGAPRWSEEARR